MKDTPTHRSENKRTMPNLMYSQNANELQKQRDIERVIKSVIFLKQQQTKNAFF